MLDKKDLVTIRPSRPEDKNFILATWLRGLYYGDSWFSQIPKDAFMAHYHTFLEALLNRPGVQVMVCCLKDDDDVILGYSVLGLDSLHWVFVKSAWRKIGIGRSLVPTNIKTVSHLTQVGRSLLRKVPGVAFNPFNI
jgi:hypothetical protein